MAKVKFNLNKNFIIKSLICIFSIFIVFYLFKFIYPKITKNIESLENSTNEINNVKNTHSGSAKKHEKIVWLPYQVGPVKVPVEPKPTCGNGIFIDNANSDITVVPQSKTYQHSNVQACEVECTPERSCFGISFDTKSKDNMKKCTLYSGAPSNMPNSIKANTICSRKPPKCSSFKINNDMQELGNIIKYTDKQSYFIHSNVKACEAECSKRDNCVGILYDDSSTSSENKIVSKY